MSRDPGHRILNRRYRLEKLLGEGAMGSVFLALDSLGRDRPVALKLLAPRKAQTGSRQRLSMEFQTLSRLRHPHLIQVFDLGIDHETGRWFLTMEYVPGPTLSRWKPRRPQDLLEMAVPLLQALDYIHARGIVHADIKPANILL
ncbi:MAG: serine/threonine-protein kinase, partial [Acidobacteriota bacterium]